MRRRWQLVPALIPTAYLLAVGATWNGVLNPNVQQITLLLLVVGVGAWLLWHLWQGWQWHTTPLDLVLVGWGAAFALSIVANPETWRRSVEACWYMLLYMLVWYVLTDLFSNGIRRTAWVNGLLIVGVVQLLFALLQSQAFYAAGGTGLPRPVGTIGNPNSLGALLVVLLPLALAAVVNARHRLERGVMLLYTLATLGVLAATFSRGAWIGAAAALLVLALFGLSARGLLSLAALRDWWRGQSSRVRLLAGGTVALSALGMAGLLIAVLLSLGVGGRGADLRTLLWSYALDLFQYHPLTGSGLFTYGHYLPSYWSIPPQQPHSHPHNLPLLVLAELGIVGALVALVTLWAIGRAARRNWRTVPATERWVWAGAASALVGVFVHHLFDTPAMMPAIALVTMLLVAVVVVPWQPVTLQANWRRLGHPLGMAALWLVLLLAGWWQSGIMTQDVAILSAAAEKEDNAAAALALDAIIAQDPQQAAYRWQQAYFYGLAAYADEAYLPQALAAYEIFSALEPSYAPTWLNLAALRWQAGQGLPAREAARRARDLAPEWTLAVEVLSYYSGQTSEVPQPVESIYAANTAYYQYLRFVFTTELLPQIGLTR